MTYSDGTTAPQTPGARLRARLAAGQLIVAPGVFDGISAHLVGQMGFEAAYLTGAGTARPEEVATAVAATIGATPTIIRLVRTDIVLHEEPVGAHT